jgi:hypothetical protein
VNAYPEEELARSGSSREPKVGVAQGVVVFSDVYSFAQQAVYGILQVVRFDTM